MRAMRWWSYQWASGLSYVQPAALSISIPLGIWSAYRRGTTFDHATLLLCLAKLSVPSFVLALGLIYVFALHLNWLPATGFVALDEGVFANLESMVLPVVALALTEVPVSVENSPRSTVRVARDATRLVRDLFRIRRWAKRGAYDDAEAGAGDRALPRT